MNNNDMQVGPRTKLAGSEEMRNAGEFAILGNSLVSYFVCRRPLATWEKKRKCREKEMMRIKISQATFQGKELVNCWIICSRRYAHAAVVQYVP